MFATFDLAHVRTLDASHACGCLASRADSPLWKYRGLLSEVAVLSFEELTNHLQVDYSIPTRRLRKQGVGYMRFALAHPGRFHLMFRKDLVSEEHVALKEAGAHALAELEETVRAMRSVPQAEPLDIKSRAMLAIWPMVHGFAHLALDGKLTHASR